MPRARTLLWIAWALLWPPLVVALTHHVAEPDVPGRGSTPLFPWALLLAGAGVLAAGTFLYRTRPRARKEDGVLRALRAVRARRATLLGAVLAPLAAWLSLAAVLLARPGPVGPTALLCLLDLALLVVVWSVALALSERSAARQRAALLKTGFALVGTVAGLGVVEVVGRVALRDTLHAWDLNPPHLDLRFRSDEFDTRIVTNGQGLREDREIPRRRSDETRVVAVGDSMTFGWGVDNDEAYPFVTETLLRTEHGIEDVEVINMGRAGYTPADYLRLIRRHAARYAPDIVVVGFVVGNDCPVQPPPTLRSRGQILRLVAWHAARSREDSRPGLAGRSFVSWLVRSGLRGLEKRVRGAGAPWLADPIYGTPNPLAPDVFEPAIGRQPDAERVEASYRAAVANGWVCKGWSWEINPWLIMPLILRPTGIADGFAVRAETRDAMRSEWELCERLLVEMRAACGELGAALVVLTIPWAYQVDASYLEFAAELGCEVPAELTTERIVNDWIVESCRRNDIACVDPLERLRGHRDRKSLYFPRDAHLTPAGQREVAAELARELAGSIEELRAR